MRETEPSFAGAAGDLGGGAGRFAADDGSSDGPEYARALLAPEGVPDPHAPSGRAPAARRAIHRIGVELGCDAAVIEVGDADRARVVAGRGPLPEDVLTHPHVRAVTAGRRVSATVHRAGRLHHVAAVRDGTGETLLLVSADAPGPPGLPAAVARTAWALGVHARAERADHADRVLADMRRRFTETAFRLLCSGQTAVARQIAEGLGRTLPDPVRLCVLEGVPRALRTRYRDHPDALGASFWAFRASVRHDAVVLLAPAHHAADLEEVANRLVRQAGCAVGLSTTVPLREVGTGYEQALHALYAAGSHPGRSRFESRTKLALLLGPEADDWALDFLRPLLAYEPPRRTAPDADELLHTTRTWLRLAQHAPRGLDIHRNTTRERLRLVSELLGIDFGRIADQSIVSLALRVRERSLPDGGHDAPPPVADGAAVPLTALLDSSEAVAWSERQIRPLLAHPSDTGLRTVRCWLAHDARVAATAETLGLSVSATRKRLVRTGRDLGRSLLELPGARHDLWLALHIHDRSEARSPHSRR
ncbi:helix-turn-helix domain-containing protein [Yinghuangia sp. ASG 101]|uniref:PucR family transcriptional regulator n=1 Tax=Yinghuangia sp. ASG 101 TaxID=2896848 RepID=UPI001E378B42|nr:helix-turn-helix domain-containing protein [Yinghuangia sp. ASG 101]UGQ10836.1 helix-turn-helix domain-containing protein [Yinghuangia sp. ASG 101]